MYLDDILLVRGEVMQINEGFIICNNSIKEKILKITIGIKNYIFLTIEELQEKMNFTVKKCAVYKLMREYNFSYSLSLEYIRAVKMIENKSYLNPKLDSIVSVLSYLEKNGLINRDTLFLHKLKQFPITFICPDYSKEYIKIKDKVALYTTVYEVDINDNSYLPKVYEFNTILDEVLFVMNRIKELVNKKISLNNIYILNTDDNYLFLLNRLAKSYQIPIEFTGYSNILSSEIIKDFFNKCLELNSFNEILKLLDNNNPLYPSIVDVINEYELINEQPKDCIPFLNSIFKKAKYPHIKYTEAIHIANEQMLFSNNDYVFYLGFNLGSSPKIAREDGFLNDEALNILNYSTSFEKNEKAFNRLKQFIHNTPNLILSYKNYVKQDKYLPSLLINELKLEVIKDTIIPYGDSKLEDELRLVGLYDLYLKYGQWHNDLEKYGIGSARYKDYNHKFKGLSQEIMNNHFKDKKLKLAYSNVKMYFACPFYYYADRILGLNEFKPQMAARLGTFSHAVLEESYETDFNFNYSVLKHRDEIAVDGRDEFFFEQMTSVLNNLISFNREHEQISELKEIRREEHIEIIKEDYLFEGYIDKLMYKIEGNDVYAAIVDYKTGADIVSLDNIEDGFNLQLPSYMYLISKYEPFKNLNLHIIGIYLQKVNIVIFDNKSDVGLQMEKKFMLEGYSISKENLLEMLDPTYSKSTYIKSLGLSSKGFLHYSKIFKETDQKRIINMVEGLLDKAAKGIRNGEFNIEPKKINGKNASCTFCKYKDICFYDYSDLKELSYKPFNKESE